MTSQYLLNKPTDADRDTGKCCIINTVQQSNRREILAALSVLHTSVLAQVMEA